MRFQKLLSTLWFTLSAKLIQCSENCLLSKTAIMDNVHIRVRAFRELMLTSVYDCAAKCAMSSACKAFDFNHKRSKCHLHRNSSDETGTGSKEGSIASDILQWPESVAGPCSTKLCPVDHECVVDRFVQPVCSKEFLGCAVPTSLPDTVVTYDSQFLGSQAVYTCADNFRSCDDSATWQLTCETSGKWEGKSSSCERYQWIDLAVSEFGSRIPCGPTEKVNVTWTGTPLRATRFQTFFETDTDKSFYANIRFDDKGPKRTIVMNTQRNDIWEEEQYSYYFPFDVNSTFALEMTLLHGEYMLSVNGRELMRLRERWAGKPDKIRISGAVNISRVKITLG